MVFDGGSGGEYEAGLASQEARIQLAHQQVPRHLETEPTARHAWCHLEEVGHNPLVEAAEAFGLDNLLDRVTDSCVLVAHSAHGVDLEAATKDVEGVCDCLCYRTRDSACGQLPDGARVFVSLAGELCSGNLVNHEIKTDIRSNAGDRRDNAAVKRWNAALGLVHGNEECPHARQFLAGFLLEAGE